MQPKKTPYSYTVSLERYTAVLDGQKIYVCIIIYVCMHAYTVWRLGVCVRAWRGWEENHFNMMCGFLTRLKSPPIQTRHVSMILHVSLSVHLCMRNASSSS